MHFEKNTSHVIPPVDGTLGDIHEPLLTVVIAHQQGEIEACLASLGPRDRRVEVIVASNAPISRHDARCVGSPSASLPMLMGRGAAVARGRYLAMTESCFRFGAGWLEAILDVATSSGALATGGAVEPDPALNGPEMALYLCDYAQFALLYRRGPAEELAGGNIVLRRDALPAASEMAERGFWKTFTLAAFQRDQVRSDPGAVMYYGRRSGRTELLRRRWMHGRCFGAMRAAKSTIGWRALYAFSGPIVPLLTCGRLFRRLLASARFRGPALREGPWIVIAMVVWWAGEWTGNLAGPGGACQRL